MTKWNRLTQTVKMNELFSPGGLASQVLCDASHNFKENAIQKPKTSRKFESLRTFTLH